MPFKVIMSDYETEVTGEQRLRNVRNPAEKEFEPIWAKVTMWDDRIDVIVKGPLISASGKALKSWGLDSFDQDEIADGSAPQWVIDLVRQVQGK